MKSRLILVSVAIILIMLLSLVATSCFRFRMQECILVETLEIPADNPNGADSGVLEAGKDYKFVVTGTWQDGSTANHYIDAEYTTFDSWASVMDGTSSWGPDQKDLQVDMLFVDWGPFSSSHEYSLMYTGDGSAVNLRIFDGWANEMPPVMKSGWYGDNEGFLTVEIYECFNACPCYKLCPK